MIAYARQAGKVAAEVKANVVLAGLGRQIWVFCHYKRLNNLVEITMKTAQRFGYGASANGGMIDIGDLGGYIQYIPTGEGNESERR